MLIILDLVSFNVSSGQMKDGDDDDSSTCSTVDKPPEVEEVESEEEDDSVTPVDCFTESKSSTTLIIGIRTCTVSFPKFSFRTLPL